MIVEVTCESLADDDSYHENSSDTDDTEGMTKAWKSNCHLM